MMQRRILGIKYWLGQLVFLETVSSLIVLLVLSQFAWKFLSLLRIHSFKRIKSLVNSLQLKCIPWRGIRINFIKRYVQSTLVVFGSLVSQTDQIMLNSKAITWTFD